MIDEREELKVMIERGSVVAEKIFEMDGYVPPIYYAITETGESFIAPSPADDKDAAVALIKALFEIKHVARYIFIDEAWWIDLPPSALTDGEMARIDREGLRNHPNRKEAIMLMAESRTAQIGGRRDIIRKGKKAKLGPLILDNAVMSEGRMVGLLKPQGTMQ